MRFPDFTRLVARNGASGLEYGMLAALVAVGALAAVATMSDSVGDAYSGVNEAFSQEGLSNRSPGVVLLAANAQDRVLAESQSIAGTVVARYAISDADGDDLDATLVAGAGSFTLARTGDELTLTAGDLDPGAHAWEIAVDDGRGVADSAGGNGAPEPSVATVAGGFRIDAFTGIANAGFDAAPSGATATAYGIEAPAIPGWKLDSGAALDLATDTRSAVYLTRADRPVPVDGDYSLDLNAAAGGGAPVTVSQEVALDRQTGYTLAFHAADPSAAQDRSLTVSFAGAPIATAAGAGRDVFAEHRVYIPAGAVPESGTATLTLAGAGAGEEGMHIDALALAPGDTSFDGSTPDRTRLALANASFEDVSGLPRNPADTGYLGQVNAWSQANGYDAFHADPGAYIAPADGSHYIDLIDKERETIAISQTVPVRAGHSYRISYWAGPRYAPSGPESRRRVRVSLNGAEVATTTVFAEGLRKYTHTVAADSGAPKGGEGTLTVEGLVPELEPDNVGGAALDQVAITDLGAGPAPGGGDGGEAPPNSAPEIAELDLTPVRVSSAGIDFTGEEVARYALFDADADPVSAQITEGGDAWRLIRDGAEIAVVAAADLAPGDHPFTVTADDGSATPSATATVSASVELRQFAGLANGGFETHPDSVPVSYGRAASTIPGWTRNSAFEYQLIDGTTDRYAYSVEGDYFVDMGNPANGEFLDISQEVTVDPDLGSTLTIFTAEAKEGQPRELEVLWDGSVIATLDPEAVGQENWQEHRVFLPASGETTATLGLRAADRVTGSNLAIFIDDVALRQGDHTFDGSGPGRSEVRLANGSFEGGDSFPGWTQTTAYNPYLVTAGDADAAPVDGAHYLDMIGSDGGGLSITQDIPVRAGHDYRISWWQFVRNAAGGPGGYRQLEVSWNGETVAAPVSESTQPDAHIAVVAADAGDGSGTLRLSGVTPPLDPDTAAGVAIDNIGIVDLGPDYSGPAAPAPDSNETPEIEAVNVNDGDRAWQGSFDNVFVARYDISDPDGDAMTARLTEGGGDYYIDRSGDIVRIRAGRDFSPGNGYPYELTVSDGTGAGDTGSGSAGIARVSGQVDMLAYSGLANGSFENHGSDANSVGYGINTPNIPGWSQVYRGRYGTNYDLHDGNRADTADPIAGDYYLDMGDPRNDNRMNINQEITVDPNYDNTLTLFAADPSENQVREIEVVWDDEVVATIGSFGYHTWREYRVLLPATGSSTEKLTVRESGPLNGGDDAPAMLIDNLSVRQHDRRFNGSNPYRSDLALTNGSFEAGSDAGWSSRVTSSVFTPYKYNFDATRVDGDYYADLVSSDGNGEILVQNVPVRAGARYRITYWAALRNDSHVDGGERIVASFWNQDIGSSIEKGETVGAAFITINDTRFRKISREVDAEAYDGGGEIAFWSGAPDGESAGVQIDNVSVVEIE